MMDRKVKENDMTTLEKIWDNGIAICFAANESYAPYCKVALASLLNCRNKDKNYDILIMTKDMTEQSRNGILALEDSGVSIRFVDMTCMESQLQSEVGAYYSVETNYRLAILSEVYHSYERMIYLDSDMLVCGDISRLYESDTQGKALAAARDYTMDYKQICKVPIFIGEEPYSACNYCEQILGIKQMQYYVNAGVLLFDLSRCRQQKITYKKAIEILHQQNYFHNDQDVLNILCHNSIHLIETKWNYLNLYENYKNSSNEAVRRMAAHIPTEERQIIHYIGERKPWNAKGVPLQELYHRKSIEIV